MLAFSKLRFVKKAVKEHKPGEPEKSSQENKDSSSKDVKVQYKHIPRHAAIDALNGAPASWQFEDKENIRAAHKRRNQLNSGTESAVDWRGSNGSTSSHLSLYRPSSYRSTDPAWWANENGITPSMLDSGLGSSLALSNMSSRQNSLVGSSCPPTASDSDHVEIFIASQHQRKQTNVLSEREIFERLSATKNSKIGEAPLLDAHQIIVAKFAIAETATEISAKTTKRGLSKGKGREIPAKVIRSAY